MELLPYLSDLVSKLSDPHESSLTVLARGLGLRTLICTLLKIFDSPKSLILVLNATSEEEAGIGEQLGIMGCRNPGLRVVRFEMPRKERQALYKKGGLIAVTSRILIVDMLLSDIPVELITGMIVMHAERVTALDPTAFITRLYRAKNQSGFTKAFSDQPESMTSGLSPLRDILKVLQIRSVHIYPRFHEDIKNSLKRRTADVVELSQPLSESMEEIHGAIVTCMNATLNELKRSNTSLDLDDIDIKSAYFRSFDAMVRRQLEPVWHKVGARTKKLVSDLSDLRKLLSYLLSYDPLSFHTYLETILASNSSASNSLLSQQNQSPWLTMDAAHTIFSVAKRRCYTNVPALYDVEQERFAIEVEQDAGWDVLDEIEGVDRNTSIKDKERSYANSNQAWWERESGRPEWLPKEVDPVLEEPPKWSLLAEVLCEIEREIHDKPGASMLPGSDTVLVMTTSNKTCSLLREYLDTLDLDAPKGQQGRRMMLGRLRSYLGWKAGLHSSAPNKGNPTFKRGTGLAQKTRTLSGDEDELLSEAMKKKDRDRRIKAANRRRVRGSASNIVSLSRQPNDPEQSGIMKNEEAMMEEAENIADFLSSQVVTEAPTMNAEITEFDDQEFDTNYGLLPPEQTVIVRAYSDDGDDQVLSEIRPRYIVMYEPNQDFIRRIEVYRNSNSGLGVRVYFMFYSTSCEEHKYLAGVRREKESFERLIKERGGMLMPIIEERRSDSGPTDALLRTISTRVAGGGQIVTGEPSQIIVDMREFRSSLPNLLHASNLTVIPATLIVGDYILTPEICVERKSLPDLVSSFTSGRLYTQCELMSVYYKQPILLIEFEEHKSFSLTAVDVKSYAKPTGRYPAKKKQGSDAGCVSAAPSIQSKLVLLTLTFPRIRIIWSQSPIATSEIFKDLKHHNAEPDLNKAIAVGGEDDADIGAGINASSEDLLRCLPGITAKNVRYVMGKVGSVSEFCGLKVEQVQDILGVEPGKACWEFIHRGDKQ